MNIGRWARLHRLRKNSGFMVGHGCLAAASIIPGTNGMKSFGPSHTGIKCVPQQILFSGIGG
jgi:hypothetical protein